MKNWSDSKLVIFIKKNIHIQILLANASFALLVTILLGNRFETNDDTGMAMIAYAVNGYQTSNLVFINPIIGKALNIVISIIPALPWYSIFEYFLTFLSFSIITYILVKKDIRAGWLLSSIVLLTFGVNCYSFFQFTKVAGLCGIAGYMAFVDSLSFSGLKRVYFSAIGAIFLFLSACYRWDMFLLISLTMGLYLLRSFYLQFRIEKKKAVLNAGILACIIISCISAYLVQLKANNETVEWQYYSRFNALRAVLLDHGFPAYAKNTKLYQSLGISEDDLNLFLNWDFEDPDIFNLYSANRLCEAKEKNTYTHQLKTFINWYPRMFFNYKWFVGFLTILLLSYMADKKRLVRLVLIYAIPITAVEFYFNSINRYMQNRVDVCFFLAIALSILLMLDYKMPDNTPTRYMVMVFMLVLIAMSDNIVSIIATNYDRSYDTLDKNRDAVEVCDLVEEDKKQLYLFSTFAGDVIGKKYGFWETMQYGSLSNFNTLGGWGTYLPINMALLKDYRIINPFRDGVNRPDVTWVLQDWQVDMVYGYINRHYYDSVNIYEVKKFGNYHFYKILSDEFNPDGFGMTEQMPENMVSDLEIAQIQGDVLIRGTTYIENTNPYLGQLWAQIQSQDDYRYVPLTQSNEELSSYSTYDLIEDAIAEDITMIYGYDGKYYKIDPSCYEIRKSEAD